MNLGQFLSGAGIASESIRQTEESERVARGNQLKIEEQNRLAALQARMAQDATRQRPQVSAPQLSQNIDSLLLPEAQRFPVEFVPPAAVVTPAAPVSTVTPQALPGAPNQSAAESARLARSGSVLSDRPYQDPRGYTPPAGMTGPEQMRQLQEERLRRFADPEVARQETVPMTEQQRFAELQRLNVPAAQPTQPTKKAQQYDNKITPYDDLINKAAQQYNLDPVVFKRLIGTESSFSPTAVSPRGEKFGLGIAQIAAVHGLTREQMLDPNTAIPFAAQLFSQMVQQTGGDYSEALMRYKGATSEKGRAAMSTPIGDILSGLTLSATPAPAAAAPAAAAAAVRTDADYYLADQKSIPYEFQQLTQAYQQVVAQAQEEANLVTQQRNETARLAQMYMQSGTTTGIDTAMRMRDAINNYDIQLLKLKQGVDGARTKVTQGRVYLEGMQGLQDLELANDPRRLAAVWSQYAGVPIGIQPRSDGTFNIMVNGKKTKEGITATQLSNSARLAFDQTYRQQKSAASAKYNEEQFKANLEIQKKNAEQLSQMIREIAVERTRGNTQLAVEQLKQFRYDVKPSGAGDGTVIITPPGSGVPFIYNPTGTTVSPDGVKIESNAAYPISGLPSYGGVKP